MYKILDFKNVLIYDNYIGIQCFSSMLLNEMPNLEIYSVLNSKIINFKKMNYNDDFLNIINVNNISNYPFDLMEFGKIKRNIVLSSEIPINYYYNRVKKFDIIGFIDRNKINERTIKNLFHHYKMNKTFIDEDDKNKLLGLLLDKKILKALSQQEHIVMLQILEGKSINEISINLGIHPSTVSTYKRRIFFKMKVKNIIELQKITS
jgi:DNA-binding CsgD family transcriptional regulator